MADVKTKPTKASVAAFINEIADAKKKKEAKQLLALMKEATGEKPQMWGTALIGFGMYHYQSDRSAQKGDWPMVAFSPRKANLTVYLMFGVDKYAQQLKKVGPYTAGKSCLYLKSLDGVDMEALQQVVAASFSDMKKKYPPVPKKGTRA
ncbi:MAG: DUF1801 domain-containing protein [Candidatus Pacebacteria bacterium]|nr:DUF1801 domain-containing protein [Candidatus Paceibacterota bacterium]